MITNIDALLKPMQIIQEQLRKVGIQIELEVLDTLPGMRRSGRTLAPWSSMVRPGFLSRIRT